MCNNIYIYIQVMDLQLFENGVGDLNELINRHKFERDGDEDKGLEWTTLLGNIQ